MLGRLHGLTHVALIAFLLCGTAQAQTRSMPVGDSITQGGQGFAC